MDALSRYCIHKAVELGEPFYSVKLRSLDGKTERLAILHHSMIICRHGVFGAGGSRLHPVPAPFEGDHRGAMLADGSAVVNSIKC
jgi:hypothetical protein